MSISFQKGGKDPLVGGDFYPIAALFQPIYDSATGQFFDDREGRRGAFSDVQRIGADDRCGRDRWGSGRGRLA